MQQVLIILILLFVFCLRQSCYVADADDNSLCAVAGQDCRPVRESKTFGLADRRPGQLIGADKAFSSTAGLNPPVCWGAIVDCDSGDGLRALTGAPRSINFALPVIRANNQNYFGLVGDGKNQFSGQSRLLEADFNSPSPNRQQPDLMSVLKDIFKNEGVPGNLVWLAEVESSLNPEARSPAGAVGLFQLMPDTAQRFGLQVFPVDDRKAPDKSAKAAASYLRYLRNEFGCWSLALAAYNAGEGRVGRAMKSHNARTFREVAPYLPSETCRYVPRVMAVMALREDQMRGVPAACFRP